VGSGEISTGGRSSAGGSAGGSSAGGASVGASPPSSWLSTSTSLIELNRGNFCEAVSPAMLLLALTSLITLTAGMGITPRTIKSIPSIQVILLNIINDFFIVPSNFFEFSYTY
jgi:hypothetical protein